MGEKLDIKNIFHSVDKEIKGKFKDTYLTKQQIKKYKKHGSEFIKGVKFFYAHENIVIPVIMGSRSPKAIECDYKLAIEIDERRHKDRSIDHEIKRQNAIEKEIDCKFIRIDPDEENFNIFKAQNNIFRHIKEGNKKLLKLKPENILPT